MGSAPVGASMKTRIVNFVAEVFVWSLIAAFVEVLVTATLERWSLGDRYALHDVPAISLQGHTTVWIWISGALLTIGLRGAMIVLDRLKLLDRFFGRWWVRAILVMVAIFVAEFIAGQFFNRVLHWQLWDYSQYV